ncbi:MAG TPA: glycosyltransferase family 4 protein [Chloroflexota bacterium]|nr:glycosyltransferase family 4 protein [Chloroflexota bacterium]
MRRWPRAAFVGSYPPRECGIATFTRDLVTAIDRLNPRAPGRIAAMNDPGRTYPYPPAVKWHIDRDVARSYDEAAEFVNDGPFDLVNIQHEYGLFGGTRGDYLFGFLDRLRKPAVLTMHTTLPEPDSKLREVTRGLIHRADQTIVLAQTALDILTRDYGVDRTRLRFIPHGVPNVRFVSTDRAKQALGLGSRPVLATCGLMSPGKGIEYALDAVAGLVDEFPDLVYLVVGETHPGVRAEIGESYRDQLEEHVRQLGLQEHVIFNNRYLKYRELVLHLLACDVYIVPYLNLKQIVSGTLAYAVGCGRAVVSTPSLYAREILAEGRGLQAEARSPESLQARIGALLRNPEYRQTVQARAYAYGHEMIWPNVARAYLETFQAVCDQRAVLVPVIERPSDGPVLEALTA